MAKVIDNKTKTNEFDLIIAIIGRGFADYVVSSARDAGATGATILYGRGTAEYDQHFMGVPIHPEREVVLIVVKRDIKVKVMQAIADKTTLIEEGRGLCFSLPVNQVYGMSRLEKEKKIQIKKAEQLEKLAKKQ